MTYRIQPSFQRAVLLSVAVSMPACAATSEPDTDTSVRRGEQVFTAHCATCHGAGGDGIEPWYPSLRRLASMREPADMVETVITGRFRRGGEMNGHTIPIMPSWGQLGDADVAAVVNYVQLNWGATAGTVNAADVAAIRAELWEID